MIEQREEIRARSADHRLKAEWIDVTNSLRDGGLEEALSSQKRPKKAPFSMPFVTFSRAASA